MPEYLDMWDDLTKRLLNNGKSYFNKLHYYGNLLNILICPVNWSIYHMLTACYHVYFL